MANAIKSKMVWEADFKGSDTGDLKTEQAKGIQVAKVAGVFQSPNPPHLCQRAQCQALSTEGTGGMMQGDSDGKALSFWVLVLSSFYSAWEPVDECMEDPVDSS